MSIFFPSMPAHLLASLGPQRQSHSVNYPLSTVPYISTIVTSKEVGHDRSTVLHSSPQLDAAPTADSKSPSFGTKAMAWIEEHGIKSKTPSACTLDQLPFELLAHVIYYIAAPADLRTCLLVNKTVHKHALPRLYRKIRLGFGPAPGARFYTGEDAHENPGIEHIRCVEVSPVCSNLEGPDTSSFQEFLKLLPKAKLENFIWRSSSVFPLDLTQLLWQTQPNIQNIEVFSSDNDVQSSELAVAQVELQQTTAPLTLARSIRLVPDDAEAVLAGCMALQHCNINDFAIDCRRYQEDPAFRDEGTTEVHDGLTATLFNHHFSNIGNQPPLKWPGLRKLSLSDVDLRFSRETWFRFLILIELEELKLEYCSNVDFFISELLTGARMKLTRFTLVHDMSGEAGDRTVEHLDDFLNTMRKGFLQHLEICLRNTPQNPSLRAINQHRETLKSLHLDITSSVAGLVSDAATKHVLWTADDVNELLEGCQNLSQLAISLPLADLQFDQKQCLSDNGDFGQALDVIFQTVSLCTLNILNFPAGYLAQQSPGYYAMQLASLQRLAAYIFKEDPIYKASHERKLEVIAFGVRDRSAMLPKYFVPSEVTAMRRVYKSASPISLRQLLDEDMEVDVLRYEWRDFDHNSRANPSDVRFYIDDEEGSVVYEQFHNSQGGAQAWGGQDNAWDGQYW